MKRRKRDLDERPAKERHTARRAAGRSSNGKFDGKKRKRKRLILGIAGTRTFGDRGMLHDALSDLEKKYKVIAVHLGSVISKRGVTTRPGANNLAFEWALSKKGRKTYTYYAEFDEYGKVAGLMRNTDQIKGMLKDTEARRKLLLVFWNGKSTGTKDIIKKAKRAGITVKVISFRE